MIDRCCFAVYDDYMKSKFANYEARREDLIYTGRFCPAV